jgi:uncharacterized phage protein gp47/JayE
MPAFQAETARVIAQRMINKTVSRTALNDLTQTSEFYQVIMAVARACEKTQQGMEDLLDDTDPDRATGEMLDELAKKLNPDLLSRLVGTYSTSTQIFARAGTTGTTTIPLGTQVKVPASAAGEDLVFATTAAGSITPGNYDSAPIAITAAEVGTKYRVDPNTINGFVSKPAGVETTYNPSAVTNGLDDEMDDEYRRRIKDYIKGLARCPVYSLEATCRSVQDAVSGKRVVWCNVYEKWWNALEIIIYVDDGSGTAESTTTVTGGPVLTAVGGEVDIYLPHKPIKESSGYVIYRDVGGGPVAMTEWTQYYFNPASGHIRLVSAKFPTGLDAGDVITGDYVRYTGLIEEVQKVIDGDAGDRSTYPGHRAGGVLAKVQAPLAISQTVTVNIDVIAGYDQATVQTAVEAVISAYINGLGINEDVIYNELVERIMTVVGVHDCNLTDPAANQTINDGQIARISSSALTVT